LADYFLQKATASLVGRVTGLDTFSYITQPRVSDLLQGKLSKFSLDALANMLARLGSDIKLRVAPP